PRRPRSRSCSDSPGGERFPRNAVFLHCLVLLPHVVAHIPSIQQRTRQDTLCSCGEGSAQCRCGSYCTAPYPSISTYADLFITVARHAVWRALVSLTLPWCYPLTISDSPGCVCRLAGSLQTLHVALGWCSHSSSSGKRAK